MGIYIPNMDKPKECIECQWHLDFYIEDEQVGGLCTITEKDDKENTCPLIEIVRCGECKWWDRKDKESPFGYCHAEKHCHFSNNWEICIYRTYKADHFCADGERRADETQP